MKELLKNSRTQERTNSRTLSDSIRQWAKEHQWYKISHETNQGRLDREFGGAIEAIAQQMDYHDRPKLRRAVLDCWDHLTAKCMKIDVIIRAGCRSEAETLELEFLRSKAVGAAFELAEVIELLQVKSETLSTKYQTNSKPQNSNGGNSNSPEGYITFGEAANMLGVSKSTVSKWAKKGRISDNGLAGRKKRLSKVSVLLVKDEIEEKELRQDVRDLREDGRRIK